PFPTPPKPKISHPIFRMRKLVFRGCLVSHHPNVRSCQSAPRRLLSGTSRTSPPERRQSRPNVRLDRPTSWDGCLRCIGGLAQVRDTRRSPLIGWCADASHRIAQRSAGTPCPNRLGIEVPEREPHISGKGVLAVQTVKAALVAAIAIVALVVSLLPGLAEEDGTLVLTISIDGA